MNSDRPLTQDGHIATIQQFLNSVTSYHNVREEVQNIIQNSFNLAQSYAKYFSEFHVSILFSFVLIQ